MGVRTAHSLYLLMSLVKAIQNGLHLVQHILVEAGHLLYFRVLLSCSLPSLHFLSSFFEQLLEVINGHDITLQFLRYQL